MKKQNPIQGSIPKQDSTNPTNSVNQSMGGSQDTPQSRQERIQQKYQLVFNNYLIPFFTEIKTTYPQSKQMVKRAYLKYKKVDRVKYIQYVIQKIKPYLKMILEKDDLLFAEEFSVDPIKFLPEFDFKELWLIIIPRVKSSVWVLLQNLYISGNYALGNKNDPGVLSILENLQIEKQIAAECTHELKKEEQENAAGGGITEILGNLMSGMDGEFGDIDLAQIFGQDNIIVQIAADVKDEFSTLFDMTDPNQDPIQAFIQLFSDQEKLKTIIASVEQKFKKYNLSPDQDISKLLNTDFSKFQDIFKSLMGENNEMSAVMEMLSKTLEGDLSGPELVEQNKKLLEEMKGKLDPVQRKSIEDFMDMISKNMPLFDQMNK
jgi:hypothetical protein